MEIKSSFLCLFALLGLNLSVIGESPADFDGLAFDNCCRLSMSEYIQMRNFFIGLDPARLNPLLEEKEKSPDLDKRMLAEIIRTYIATPEKHAAWDKELTDLIRHNNTGFIEAVDCPVYKQIVFKINSEAIPPNTFDKPLSFYFDIFWSDPRFRESESKLAARIQFNLSPSRDFAQMLLDFFPLGFAFLPHYHLPEALHKPGERRPHANPYSLFLVREGLFKLKDREKAMAILAESCALVDDMEQILIRNDTEQQLAEKGLKYLSRKKIRVAAYAASRLGIEDAAPLIIKLLSTRFNFPERRQGETVWMEISEMLDSRKELEYNKYYFEDLCEALSYLKAEEGIPVIIKLTVLAARSAAMKGRQYDPNFHNIVSYKVLSGLLADRYGRKTLPYLQQILEEISREGDKVILNKIISDIDGWSGKEKEIAELEEEILLQPKNKDLAGLYIKLYNLSGKSVLAKLDHLSRRPSRFCKAPEFDDETVIHGILAMGDTKEPGTAELIRRRISEEHGIIVENLASILREHTSTRIDRPDTDSRDQHIYKMWSETRPEDSLDMYKLRLDCDAFGAGFSQISISLKLGDALLLALRRLGCQESEDIISKALSYPEFLARARASAMMIKGEKDKLVEELSSANPQSREEAALALYDMGDERCFPEIVSAAARRSYPSYIFWKSLADASRSDLTQVLEGIIERGDTREKVLARAMLIQRQDEKLLGTFYDELKTATEKVTMMQAWGIRDLEKQGKSLAENPRFTGERGKFLHLLEHTAVFGQGIARRGIAAFAIAELASEDSMKSLVESFSMGSLGGSNPAALALSRFGEKGLALARALPPPIPGQMDTGVRMTMHRGGVQILSENLDIKGVDDIVEGLDALSRDPDLDNWSYRAEIYLTAAEKYHDKRLIPPLKRLLDQKVSPFSDVHDRVISCLKYYVDDQELPELFWGTFERRADSTYEYSRTRTNNAAIAGLSYILGKQFPDFIVRKYKENHFIHVMPRLAKIFAELSYPKEPQDWNNRAGWQLKNPGLIEEISSDMREKAFVVLSEDILSENRNFRRAAAVALANWGIGTTRTCRENSGVTIFESYDLRAVKPLNQYIESCAERGETILPRTREESDRDIVSYLSQFGDKETQRIALDLLRRDPGNISLREIVSALKTEGSLPLMVEIFMKEYALATDELSSTKWEKTRQRGVLSSQLHLIKNYGPDGLRSLLEIFREIEDLSLKLRIVDIFEVNDFGEAAEAIADLAIETHGSRRGYSSWRFRFTLEKLDKAEAKRYARIMLKSEKCPSEVFWGIRMINDIRPTYRLSN